MEISQLEKEIDYTFQDIELLKLALTHASFANEHSVQSNERLEFLGDAVLELCMSRYLYNNFSKNEGVLTKTRAKAVCEESLALYAKKIELGNYLFIGKGEEQGGGRHRPALLADAFEAVLGAIFLDSNFQTVYKTFEKLVLPHFGFAMHLKDYKSTFQEHVQADKRSLHYEIVHEEGPANSKKYEAVVYMDDILMGRGYGRTKKEAEQNAAKEALEKEARA